MCAQGMRSVEKGSVSRFIGIDYLPTKNGHAPIVIMIKLSGVNDG